MVSISAKGDKDAHIGLAYIVTDAWTNWQNHKSI